MQCDECDRKYQSAKSLAKHKRLAHQGMVTKFKCPMCESVLGQAHTLKEHLWDVHHQKKQIKDTKTLGTQFTREVCVQPQIANEGWKKVPTLICVRCGRNCKGSSNLKRHIKNVHLNAAIKKTIGSQKKNRNDQRDRGKLQRKSQSKISRTKS